MPKKRKTRRSENAVLPGMRPNAAGIDIGSTEINVAVPTDRDAENLRSFPTFTQDLYALAEWLKRCAIEMVAMESTGVYFALSSALIARVQSESEMASEVLSVVGLPSWYLKHSQKLCRRVIGGGSGPEKGAGEGGWEARENQMSKGGEVDIFHE